MTTPVESARDDLAFLRGLMEEADQRMGAWGEAYLAGGLVYGGQMLLHAAQALGALPTAPPWGLLVGLGPTVLFIPLMIWISWRHRKDRPPAIVGRAVASVFAAVGLANLALIAVIGSVAWREHSLTIWLIYPCTVFVLQGAAWLVAYMMRRRAWLLWVSVGWFAAAIAMGFTVTQSGYFILFAGLGLWLCMALPGWLMIRGRAKA